LPHQVPIVASAAPNKIVCAGRRFGKDVLDFQASVVGHGPVHDGMPQFGGIIHGGDVVWIGPTFSQVLQVWREQVRPRFAGVPGIVLNESEHTVRIVGKGTLFLRSAEAIDSVRGMGSRLSGVVMNEAAHCDLEYALRSVIRPALLDNQGWLLITSTPYAGSYFNTLCDEVELGVRGDTWQYFHGTARDNTAIDPDAFQALVAEYPKDSVELEQEVFAKRVEGGAGAAFPEWDAAWHCLRVEPIPGDWRLAAGMDWGYDPDDGVIVMAAYGPGHREHLCFEYVFRRKTPDEVGYEFGLELARLGRYPEYLVFDPSMSRVDDGGPTIMEHFYRGLQRSLQAIRIPMLPAPTGRRGPRGETSREIGKLLFHEGLRAKADAKGVIHPWGRPSTTVDPVRCPRIAASMPKLRRDERRPSDVATRGQWDHGYDAWRYLKMSRVPGMAGPVEVIPEHVHPGFIPGTFKRRSTRQDDTTRLLEAKESMEAAGHRGVVSRYERPPK
jgi:hypothetical protein